MVNIVTYDYLEHNGRLGNQLWQIGWQIGEAERLNAIPSIKKDWSYKEFFSVPNEFYGAKGRVVKDGGTGYYQELDYVDNVLDRIVEYFKPSLGLGNILGDDWCSIHMRRGDYLKYPKIYPLPTAKYYKQAVQKVVSENPEVKFALFSDDIKWCSTHIDYFGLSDKNVRLFEPTITPVEVVDRINPPKDHMDLFSMTTCGHHIVSNSTFAWWGAFLSNNSNVIYPSVWFGRDKSVASIPWKKMIPKTWICVPC